MVSVFHLNQFSQAFFREANDSQGKAWDVILIEEGLSGNGVYYGINELQEAMPLFDGRPAFAHQFIQKGTPEYDHLPADAKLMASGALVGEPVGLFSDVRLGETSKGKQGILARFTISENAKWLQQFLKEAWDKGKQVLGFSIDAVGDAIDTMVNGIPAKQVIRIERVDSVDVVSHPAAGGQVLRLVASRNFQIYSQENNMGIKELLLRLLEAIDAKILEGKDKAQLTESDTHILFNEAVGKIENGLLANIKPALLKIQEAIKNANGTEATKLIESLLAGKGFEMPAPAPEPKPAPAPAPVPVSEPKSDPALAQMDAKLKEMQESLAKTTCLQILNERLAESKLPSETKDRVRNQYTGKVFTKDELENTLKVEELYLAKLQESGKIKGMGMPNLQVGEGQRERLEAAMMGLFTGKDEKTPKGEIVPAFFSIKQAYRECSGDHGEVYPEDVIFSMSTYTPPSASKSYWSHKELRMFEARRRMIESMRLTESLATADFGEICGDVLNKRLVALYRDSNLQEWRKIVSSIVPYTNTMTQRGQIMGGYTVAPTVAEGGNYEELSKPTDTEYTATPIKKGFLQSITEEMIDNDSVRALRNIPIFMAESCNMGLYRNIFDMFVNNQQQDGSTAIASGALSTTAALSSAALTAARTAMMDQAAYGRSYNVMGKDNQPRYLLVPNELDDLALKLCKATSFVNPAYASTTEVASSNPNPHSQYGLDYITIPYWTSSTIWWAVADPAKRNTIEVGFYQGRQEPEMFIQNDPTSGSMFNADKLTYKVRYRYYYAIMDTKSFCYSTGAA